MIKVYANKEALSFAMAELFAAVARQAVRARGRFVVALSGGNTRQRTYELLSRKPFRELIPWQNIHVFWGDERCVSADNPRSNAWMVLRG